MPDPRPERVEWCGCYDGSWRGVITDDSFAHPAKMARGLLDRILDHGLARGYWQVGDLIADPFGGIGTTGILAGYKGLRSVSCELEPRFFRMATEWDCPGYDKGVWARFHRRWSRYPGWAGLCPLCQKDPATYERNSGRTPHVEAHHYEGNFALHAAKLEALGCPLPVMVEGDSRRFASLVSEAGAIVTSPPYADQPPEKSSDGIDLEKQYETYRAHGGGASFAAFSVTQRKHAEGYGSAPGQIGRLPAGDVQAVITSPPYVNAVHDGNSIDLEKTERPGKHSQAKAEGYGATAGNIGNLKEGDAQAVRGIVTSPPYTKQAHHGGKTPTAEGVGRNTRDQRPCEAEGKHNLTRTYGQADGQIDELDRETYWHAMAEVYRQCHLVLKPGGVLAVVIKRYVKKGKIVPLPDQTWDLLLSLGFQPLERVRAMLVKETREAGLFGKVVSRKERKSFFRRLAERKGAPAIDWEDVLFVNKAIP